jgi:hypothetical protein
MSKAMPDKNNKVMPDGSGTAVVEKEILSTTVGIGIVIAVFMIFNSATVPAKLEMSPP